jgi:hypothetical protein
METQSQAVLKLLRTVPGGVTQQDAIAFISCYRLAARISDLRADGYRIQTTIVTQGGHHFARYTIEESPEQLSVGL